MHGSRCLQVLAPKPRAAQAKTGMGCKAAVVRDSYKALQGRLCKVTRACSCLT